MLMATRYNCSIPLERCKDHVPGHVFALWSKRTILARERQLELAYRAQIDSLQSMVQDALEHHVKLIRNMVLTDVCPRCKVAFAYEGGCLAINCPNCHCGFCSFCMTDQGSLIVVMTVVLNPWNEQGMMHTRTARAASTTSSLAPYSPPVNLRAESWHSLLRCSAGARRAGCASTL
jgi:hypothetical protein